MMAVASPAIVAFSSFGSSTAVRQSTVSLMRCSLLRSRKQIIAMSLKLLVQKSAYLQPSPTSLRAASSDEVSSNALDQFEETLEELKTKWETLENKSIIGTYATGAIILCWFSASLIGAINPIPLLPQLMELVGLGYSIWFAYRYLVFKTNREELSAKINTLKERIIGTVDDAQN